MESKIISKLFYGHNYNTRKVGFFVQQKEEKIKKEMKVKQNYNEVKLK